MVNSKVANGLLVVLMLNLFSPIIGAQINNELNIPVELTNKIVGVRLSDLVAVNPSAIPGIANVKEVLAKNIGSLYSNSAVETVHDVFFQEIPTVIKGKTHLDLVAVVKYKNGKINFEKLNIEYTKSTTNIADYVITSKIIGNVNDMMFEGKVGLVDRKFILEDQSKNIKMVFPIGVGSFDEGVLNEGRYSLLTPRMKHAFLDKRVVISKREKPRYFQGKPFIRILKGSDLSKDLTPIAFHIEINDSFVRGFDSHGCMRMREMDLMTTHDLIMYGPDRQIPLTISYRPDDESDSPIAKRNKTYKTILNVGSKSAPYFTLDRDNLVQTTYVENKLAPMDQLIDDVDDNYEDIFSYDTELQLKDQENRRVNECKAKVLAGQIGNDEKSLSACINRGKRKTSLGDRIYRQYMGVD